MSGKSNDVWRVWEDSLQYGEMLYHRAIGQAPEMESSKAVANFLEDILQPGSRILDVGCGAGHYLRSLRNRYPFQFFYMGVDATKAYIDLAEKAFANDADAQFRVDDIYNLSLDDQSFDIVLCNNLLLHLPGIVQPIGELWRVTKKTLLIRSMVGKNSFRIQQIPEWEPDLHDVAARTSDPFFDASGEPLRFHYFNIYSSKYITWCFQNLQGVENLRIWPDQDFSPDAFKTDDWPDEEKPANITKIVAGLQVNGYILEPWAFIQADRVKN